MNDRPKARRHVVVGLDKSDGSTRALEWACNYAAEVGADVAAVHVWIYPTPGLRTGVSEPYDEMKLEAMQLVRDQIDAFIADHKPPVVIHTEVREGAITDVLVDESKRADLLVVGSRGRSSVAAFMLGSVSRSVAEQAVCPVVVVHDHDHAAMSRDELVTATHANA